MRYRVAPQKIVIPAKAGIQYAVAFRLSCQSLEYWIARRSLSSGAHSRDPLVDDDIRAESNQLPRSVGSAITSLSLTLIPA
ncbi:hypothetical protein V1277_005990 [Bradyrhizobium sp. AZCC 1588]